MAKGDKLSEKQKRFCEEYLIDLNATQAYQRAGYQTTPAGARTESSKLLAKPNIQSYVSKLRNRQQDRTNISADRVIQELAYVGLSRITDVVSINGGRAVVKDTKSLSEMTKAGIATISQKSIISEQGETHDIKITMHQKVPALKILADHMGLLTDLNIAIATADKYGYDLVRRGDADSNS